MTRWLVAVTAVLVAGAIALGVAHGTGSEPGARGPAALDVIAPAASSSASPPAAKAAAVDGESSAEPHAGGAPRPLPPGIVVGERSGEYVNTKDGSVLVYVQQGRFVMGSPARPREPDDLSIEVKWNDRPAHPVRLSGYFISKYEVTWRQYRRFAEERPEFALPPDAHVVLSATGPTFRATDDHPVFRVTWEQARAYCEWAGLRLPTEAEWEYAARGADEARLYPWSGDDLRPGDANLYGDLDGQRFAAPVGAFDRDVSPAGCYDMAGNVAEWVHDLFGPYTPDAVNDPRGAEVCTRVWSGLDGWREIRPGEGPLRVIRGGGWHTWDDRPPAVDFYAPGAYYYQVTRRYAGHPAMAASRVVGFRPCR